ncbi:MAG: helix-turn-helix transcriptional regulator [Candidatus Hydrothermarchaeota archaeon]
MEGAKITFITFVLLYTLTICCSANFTFSNFSISIDILREDRIYERVSFDLENTGVNPIREVEFNLFESPRQVFVWDEEGSLPFYVEEGDILVIKLRKPLITGEKSRISMELEIPGMVVPYYENHLLTFAYLPKTNISGFSLKVYLPTGASLALTEVGRGFQAVYPTPTSINTDGHRIIVNWYREKLNPGKDFRILLIFAFPKEKAGKNYLILVAFIIGIVSGLSVMYLRFRGDKKRTERILHMVLSEDEQRIYDLIVGFGGETIQSELAKRTDFSKAKLSGILRNLEEKGLIERKPYKKTNIVKLTKEIKKE